MTFWQFKVPTTMWANDGTNEYETLTKGSIFSQYIKQNKKQLGNNIGDIIFYYNSRNSKKYPIGIYLVCEIVSTLKADDSIDLKVIKDLRKKPFDYSDTFPKMHLFYNTAKLRKRAQPREKIDFQYNPELLFEMIMGRREKIDTYGETSNEQESLYEGIQKRVTTNKYERNAEARKHCIDHYGSSCQICGFNFEERYGTIGKGFIHVHHIIPLSQISKEYVVEPIKDLIPVCPNCHSMLHQKVGSYKPEEIKLMLQNR